MSLPAPYQEHYYIGDGETVEFPFGSDFTALAAANVKCIIYFQDGTSCVPTFTVNMEAGSITIVTLTKPDGEMLTVPPLGSVVRVFRDTPEQQNVTASQLQNYTAKQLERIFDAIVAMIQEGSYFAKHKTLNLTETQRDVSLEQLGEDQDQGLLYWDAESGTIKSTAYGQDELIEAVERANNVADEAKSIAQETQGNLTSHVQNLSNPHQTSLEKLTDVDIDDLQSGQFLRFDGLHWKNVSSSATVYWGDILGNILDQTDLTTYVSDGLSTKVNIDGTSIMSAPLKFVSGSMRGAVGPFLNGVSFWKMDSQGSLTNIANITDNQFYPVSTNSINLGRSANTWKDLYLGGKAYVATINNGADLSVPNKSGTLATTADVELAARSGRMLTDQGVWYAKMYAATVAPAAENGTNYADFSQVDSDDNPIIVIYTRTSGAWVQSETIVPPADYDGYVPVTSKIWDISEQAGQQGGRVLWNHTSKEFTPYPTIISFEDIEITGDSTVIMPAVPTNNSIPNKKYVDDAVAGAHYHPELLSHEWDDHERSDMNWVNALTFSWQDRTDHQVAYDHLADDLASKLNLYANNTYYYHRKEDSDVIGAVAPYAWQDIQSHIVFSISKCPSIGDVLYSDSGAQQTFTTVRTIYGYTQETVAGITVQFYLTDDGHKIVLSDQESNVTAIYNATGVAWYYIIDTVNQRFKLPRSKHNKYASSLAVVGNGKSLGLTDGGTNFGLAIHTADLNGWTDALNLNVGTSTSSGTRLSNNKAYGITTDASVSGVIALQEEDTDQYKYLYFYVGGYTQSAVENTAGLNASLFNNKADLDLANVLANIDFVVERQEPTAENNYTWYRKYRSGWVEQGGYIAKGAAAANTVIFSIPFAAKDYIPTVTGDWTGSTGAACTVDWDNATTTQMVVTKDGTGMGAFWQAKGMAAN